MHPKSEHFRPPVKYQPYKWPPVLVTEVRRYDNVTWYRLTRSTELEEHWVGEIRNLSAMTAPSCTVDLTRGQDIDTARTDAFRQTLQEIVKRLREAIAGNEETVTTWIAELETVKAGVREASGS